MSAGRMMFGGQRTRADAGQRRRPLPAFGLWLVLCSMMQMWPAAAAELLMFTRKSCAYCVLWERQIGPIYPKTAEAELAPLRKIDLDHPAGSIPALSPPVTITPTFVVMEGDREIARFSGYSDDLTFWSVLATQLAKLRAAPSAPPTIEKPLR